jgi:hypothetical protein
MVLTSFRCKVTPLFTPNHSINVAPAHSTSVWYSSAVDSQAEISTCFEVISEEVQIFPCNYKYFKIVANTHNDCLLHRFASRRWAVLIGLLSHARSAELNRSHYRNEFFLFFISCELMYSGDLARTACCVQVQWSLYWTHCTQHKNTD